MAQITYHINRRRLTQFFSKVEVTPTCWNWTGAQNGKGYGLFQGTAAHRFTYTWFVEFVPPGLELDHLCRNRGCVNPMHLEAVTHTVNVRRGIARFCVRTRITPPPTPLSAICRRELAAQLGVTERTVWRLLANRYPLASVPLVRKIKAVTGRSFDDVLDRCNVVIAEHLALMADQKAQTNAGNTKVGGSHLDLANRVGQVSGHIGQVEVRHGI